MRSGFLFFLQAGNGPVGVEADRRDRKLRSGH